MSHHSSIASRVWALSLLTALCVPWQSRADEPAALYIFPAGGQRGTTVLARIGGMHLHESCPLELLGAGVKASPTIQRIEKIWFEGPIIPQPDSQRQEDYPSDYAAQFEIAPQAELGLRAWRVSTSQGITRAMRFVVGDLPEVVEEEMDGESIAVDVTLPLTINGRIFPREDRDEWAFMARRGEVIRCEVHADRLGSPLDAQLEIVDQSGKRLAANGDYFDNDSLIVFTAPADGKYRVRIHDAAYGGLQTYVYRLTLSSKPHVLSVYPLGGQRGQSTSFELTGVNVPAEAQRIAIPTGPPGDHAQRFAIGAAETNAVQLDTSTFVELREQEPNEVVASTEPIAIPCVCNGRIDRGGDFDRWVIAAKKGEAIDLVVKAARLGSPLDSVMVIEDAEGKELSRHDDLSNTVSDSEARFVPPSDGLYVVRIEDRHRHRGGRDFAYRLYVTGAGEPDFSLTLSADALTINRDSQARFRVQAQWFNGIKENVQLAFDPPIPGVTIANDKLNRGQPQLDLVIKTAADAPIGLRHVSLRGTTKIGEQEVSRIATFTLARGGPTFDKLALAVAVPTPFKVVGVFGLPYAQRGTVFMRHYAIERNGYEGPLVITMAEKQPRHLQGVTGPQITVPAGVDEFDYPATLPPWLELSRTSRSTVTATGTIKDEQGQSHLVCYTSTHQNEQISLIASPGPLSLALDPPNLAPALGQPVSLTVQIERDPALRSPMRLELIVPKHIRGISAKPIELPGDASSGTLQLEFQPHAGPFNMPLTVRATLNSGIERVVAESKLQIVP